jgi:phosphoglycerate dehydrogenase-like enzyme
MTLVIYPPVEDRRLEMICAAATPMRVVNVQTEAEAAEALAHAEAFFGKITPELLKQAPKLRWVQSPTASLEHYMFPELVAHGCQLTNMRGLFSDVIAEHVFGCMLCLSRNLHVYLRQQRERRWAPVGGERERSGWAYGPGVVSEIDRAHRHLTGSVLGIVGLGAIGSEIAARGRAFGMEIVAVDPVNPEAWPLDRLPELLATSDWVVIAAPHTPQTEGMFGAELIRQMKPSAYLINIGRGAIVKLGDLVHCLREGAIAGAALDVFEEEPLPAEHPLWTMENVLITPHVAGYSTLVPKRHLEVLLENIQRFRSGEPLLNLVRKAEWF